MSKRKLYDGTELHDEILTCLTENDRKSSDEMTKIVIQTISRWEIEAATLRGEILRDFLRKHINDPVLQELLELLEGVRII